MQVGHQELVQQQYLEQPEGQGPVRNRFRKSPTKGALDVVQIVRQFLSVGALALKFPEPHKVPQPALDSEQMWFTNCSSG